MFVMLKSIKYMLRTAAENDILKIQKSINVLKITKIDDVKNFKDVEIY